MQTRTLGSSGRHLSEAAAIPIQGERYPEHLERLTGL
jgi:hypothetical protein